MKLSMRRARIIARREYLTTVRRKAFVFSVMFTPALIFVMTFFSSKAANDEARHHQRAAKVVAIVDSSGMFASTPLAIDYEVSADSTGPGLLAKPTTRVPVTLRRFASQAEAIDSLTHGTITQVLVVARDFAATGEARRYENDTRVFTSSSDDRHLRVWMTRGLLAGATDSAHVENVLRLGRTLPLYVPDRTGQYALKDDARELLAFFLPFGIGFLLAMSILAGGQYLLQGVAEEKETRILESLLSTVSPNDLLVGKLIGLGAAGLTLVGVWIVLGGAGLASSAAFMKVDLPPALVALGVVYFMLGYLFYASLMIGIGAITNNLREAQQFAVAFTMMNFFPIYLLQPVINSPGGPLAVGLSLFPPTAATTMMMRLSAGMLTGAVIPFWQVALSLVLLAATGLFTVRIAARVFRIGLLMYGKTPSLPEILRIMGKD